MSGDHAHGQDVVPILRACLFCRTTFPHNHTVPTVGAGQHIAFDPARGRLWLICAACDAWNLAPLETRWEAVEQLDWMTSHQTRMLTSTANIALHELAGVQIVRVGASGLREESWWRYGNVLRQRRERADHARTWGKIINAAIAGVLIGVPLANWRDANWNVDRLRDRLYGQYAWPQPLRCARCGGSQRGLQFSDRGDLRLIRAGSGDIALWNYCHHCGRAAAGAGYMLTGGAAEFTLRRVLAHQHFAGAADAQLERATTLVEEAGSGAALSARLADASTFLVMLKPHESLALEIAANEARERSLLALEAAALEQRWREEERIAAIADGELS